MTTAALADPGPTKPIDMTQVLHGPDGATFKDQIAQGADDPTCAKCPDLTLGRAIAHALMLPQASEKDLSWEQKFARGTLAMKLQDNKEAALDASDIAVIDRLVGGIYNPSVTVAVVTIIDPNRQPEKLK